MLAQPPESCSLSSRDIVSSHSTLKRPSIRHFVPHGLEQILGFETQRSGAFLASLVHRYCRLDTLAWFLQALLATTDSHASSERRERGARVLRSSLAVLPCSTSSLPQRGRSRINAISSSLPHDDSRIHPQFASSDDLRFFNGHHPALPRHFLQLPEGDRFRQDPWLV